MIGPMLAEAWSALVANRLRSLLTMLGMIIGVSAVILMLAIGGGVQKQVSDSISGLGSNLLIVTAGGGRQGGASGGAGTGAGLRLEDAEAIAALAEVVAASPSTAGPAQVVAGPPKWATNVTGATPSWLRVNEWPVDDGRAFIEREERAGARVAVIGQTVGEKLFGARAPTGEQLRIKGVSFTVIGVLEKRGQGFGGQDRDDQIVVPLTSAQRLLQANAFRGTIR
ncbi:ABC transporter permease, partial [Polymorphobacter multimanifer]|uniref:ABC transporter permease n=1 Tax=Polymorphobacter multimanifer TaxID=1070431 RepID=UPI00166D08FE